VTLPVLIASSVLAAPTIVWSTSTSVSGSRPVLVTAKGLTPGARYHLVTRGSCEVRDSPRRRRWRQRVHPLDPEPFGTEFRVIAAGEDYPVGIDENRHPIRADGPALEIRLEDRSTQSRARTVCRVTFVAIETID
jgi:hypothetical protein